MWKDMLFRLQALLGRDRFESDLDDEIGFHVQMQAEKYGASGMSRAEALRKARLAIGGVEQMKEDCRDSWGISLWETTLQDVRYGTRQLSKSPAFTLAVILTLALGIGATTGLFTTANSLLLRSLPVSDPRQLVVIARNPGRPSPLHSFAEYTLIRTQVPGALTGVAAANEGNAVGLSRVGASGGEVPAVVSAAFVSANYFEVLGVGSFAGRVLSSSDDSPTDGLPPVVLSHAFWERHFGGSLAALGQPVRVNSQVSNIVGIADPRFTGTHAGNAPDLYLPLSTFPSVIQTMRKNWNSPRRRWLVLTARLKTGVSLAQATVQLDRLFSAPASQSPDTGQQLAARVVLLPGAKGVFFAPQVSKPLWALLLAAGLLLLLACANVAGLLLARAIQREREVAIRLAVGASGLRLIRQFLTESILLATAGGMLGLLAGLAAARAIVRLLPADGPFPFEPDLAPDWRVLGFAFVASLFAALLFGLGPAVYTLRRNMTLSLKSDPSGKGRGRWLLDPRRALVAGQVAVSLLLLVSVGLVARSLRQVDALDFGFARSGVLFVYAQPGQFGYQGVRARRFYERLRDRVAVLPGVTRTSLADYAPLDGGNDSRTVARAGHDEPVAVEANAITENYLSTVGISLLAGRNLTARDAEAGAPRVGLISESLARSLFAGESAVGQSISYGEQFHAAESWQIVGVVRDARYFNLRATPTPMVYLPVDGAMSRLTLCIRTAGAPELLIPAVRRELAALDAAVPIVEAHTIAERVNEQNAPARLLATLLGAFGLLALVLAGTGLHGVLAFGVAARSREIGIRAALGARRWDAIRRVLTDVWIMVGAGAAVGLAASAALGHLLSGFLFDVRPLDMISFASALGILGAAVALASYLPARRAAKVDPAVALRHD